MNQVIEQAKKLVHSGGALRAFIGQGQRLILAELLEGEEGAWFAEKLIGLTQLIASAPKTYEQDGKGMKATAYLRYFKAGATVLITELDKIDGVSQAFGWTDLGYGGELGYVSITEVIQAGLELDLHFDPTPLKEATKT